MKTDTKKNMKMLKDYFSAVAIYLLICAAVFLIAFFFIGISREEKPEYSDEYYREKAEMQMEKEFTEEVQRQAEMEALDAKIERDEQKYGR